jgi:hypothetical protein
MEIDSQAVMGDDAGPEHHAVQGWYPSLPAGREASREDPTTGSSKDEARVSSLYIRDSIRASTTINVSSLKSYLAQEITHY